MSNPHATGRHILEMSEHFLVRAAAVVLGVAMMVSGLGMGVTMVLLPIGIPLGLIGLLVALWAVFYFTPAPAAATSSDEAEAEHEG